METAEQRKHKRSVAMELLQKLQLMCEEEFGRETSRFRPHPCPEGIYEASISSSLVDKQNQFKHKLFSRSEDLTVTALQPDFHHGQRARVLPQLRKIKADGLVSCGIQTVVTEGIRDRTRTEHKLWFGEHLCKSLCHELERLEVENEEWKHRFKEENKRRLMYKSLESKLMAAEVDAQEARMRADELSTLYQHARVTIRSLEERVDVLEKMCDDKDTTLKEERERNENQVAALCEDSLGATLERIQTSHTCHMLEQRCLGLTKANESLQQDLDRVEAKLKRRSLIRNLRRSPQK